MMTKEEKEARLEARRMARKALKEQAKIEAEKNQPPINKMTITIEWRNSRMWGSNPYAEAIVVFKNGNSLRSETFTCSGCGYDKESTVIADLFNAFLKYKLYIVNEDKAPTPYGISAGNNKYYSGGIGTECYYKISEFIGGEFKRVASGKTFDVYEYNDKNYLQEATKC
jgi:hypothetical protein